MITLQGPGAGLREDQISRLRARFCEADGSGPDVTHLGCAQLHDAAPDMVKVIHLPLAPRTPLTRVCGPVFPVTTDDDMLPCLQALAEAPPGWVVYIKNRVIPSQALVGDIYTASARVQRLGGIVVEGAARDLADLPPLRVPVFSTSVTFVSARTAEVAAADVPQAVESGRVTLRPGDWVFGDPDGFLAVAADDIEAVFAAAAVLRRREQALKAAMREKNATLAELTRLADFLAGTGTLAFSP